MYDLFELIFRFVLWPYNATKKMNEESRVGESPMDREAAGFWKNCAVIATIVIIGAVVIIGLICGFWVAR